VNATLISAVNLAVGEVAELWVTIGFTASAGLGVIPTPETFNLAIAAATDVNASAPVACGVAPPIGITLGAIEFGVANITPLVSSTAGGGTIELAGTGFMAPFSVRIGGSLCAGTPVIAGGTQVTGLEIPAGVGLGLQIVVYSGTLPPQSLTFTFDYVAPKDNETKAPDQSGCVSGSGATWPVLIGGLVILAAGATRRRRTT
jgi:hypothetical protein